MIITKISDKHLRSISLTLLFLLSVGADPGF